MDTLKATRSVRFARCVLFAALLLPAAVCFAAPETPDAMLQRADHIRTTNNAEFKVLLRQLAAQAKNLNSLQRDWLAYFEGWESGLQGDLPAAVTQLTAVMNRTNDPTLRTRARISLLNDQFNAAQFVEAYANLGIVLDSLPHIQNRNAHFLALTVAADLYNQAGQYDLAVRFTNQALAYDHSDTSVCYALVNQAVTLYKTGKLRSDDAQIRGGLDACQRIGDPIYANIIRLSLAQAAMEHGEVAVALQSLKAHDAEVQSTHSSALISMFEATLAKCYLLDGDLVHAETSASSAIDHANKQINSEPSANAWQVLYQVSKRKSDTNRALAYLEKFVIADKGYLNNVSARALAYQMIHQQVQEKKQQVAELGKANQLLQLRQQVDTKNAETEKLLLLLLLTVLVSIAVYAYRTKRAQLKFMNLARRDGLTGIFNRQHFIDASEDVLAYAAKSLRCAGLIAIDLDHFKDINDNHGHAAGDRVLKAVVAACQSQLRSLDVFGRLGGEEFGILLPDCVPERAVDIAEQMRSAIATLGDETGNGIEFPVFASFGVSATRWSGYDLRQLLADADSALYCAKREGRNRVAVHEQQTQVTDKRPVGAPDRRRS